MDKVPPTYRFRDYSDWARPIALRLARIFYRLGWHPVVPTLLFIALGLWAAWLMYHHQWRLAAVLVLLKNILDAADGSLARLRGKPSLVGRYLDSIGDALLNTLWIAVLAWHCQQWLLAGLTWLFLHLQVTTMNYFYVLYRHWAGGDTTSKPVEDTAPTGRLARFLWRLYRWYYHWQDLLVATFHHRFWRAAPIFQNRRFLSLLSLWGLGMHLTLLAVLLWWQRPCWFFIVEMMAAVPWLGIIWCFYRQWRIFNPE